MEIKGKNYNLKFTGLTLHLYKEQFHRDLLFLLTNEAELSGDTTIILGVLWALIKTVENSFPEFLEWLDSLSIQDIAMIVTPENVKEITQVIIGDNATTKELKKK